MGLIEWPPWPSFKSPSGSSSVRLSLIKGLRPRVLLQKAASNGKKKRSGVKTTTTSWRFQPVRKILLMEEILHHQTCMKPCKQSDIYHINWCRISSINTISQIGSFPQVGMKIRHVWNHHRDNKMRTSKWIYTSCTMYGIFTYMNSWFVNVGKYTSPMDPITKRLFSRWVFPYISLTYSLHRWVPPF